MYYNEKLLNYPVCCYYMFMKTKLWLRLASCCEFQTYLWRENKTKQRKQFFPVRTSVYSRKARAFRMKNTIGPGWELYKSGWHRLLSCPPFLWTWAWPWHIEGAVPALLYLCTRVQLPKIFLKARETWNSSFGTTLLLTLILEPAESDFEAHLKFNK